MPNTKRSLKHAPKENHIFLENLVENIGETVETLFMPLKNDTFLDENDKRFVVEVCELWDKYLASG